MSGLWKIIGWLLSLGGFLVQSGPPDIRVVTAIRIETTAAEFPGHYAITDQETMGAVMQYLRQLDPYVTAEIDEETFRADLAHLTVEYSDGSYAQYSQLYTDYFKTDSGPWKRIDQEDGIRLWGILSCISESDGI